VNLRLLKDENNHESVKSVISVAILISKTRGCL
jgi:hypothetical protein